MKEEQVFRVAQEYLFIKNCIGVENGKISFFDVFYGSVYVHKGMLFLK